MHRIEHHPSREKWESMKFASFFREREMAIHENHIAFERERERERGGKILNRFALHVLSTVAPPDKSCW
jgi:hypothetical protein